MASFKYKSLMKKRLTSKLGTAVSSLQKENAFLKKTLAELCREHSEHNRLVERFLTLETARLEVHQQLMAKNEKLALLSVQLSKQEDKHRDTDSTSGEWASTKARELQNDLADKNNQWLEYDQQREAYVRAILDRMLWLEKQQKDANPALSQQHNQEHSDEKEKICQMQEHYERLLKKARDELEVLRKQVDMTQQELLFTQKCCEERENEVEELKQQLQTEKSGPKRAEVVHLCSEEEEQQLREETKDLQRKLDEEKRRSGSYDLQVNLFQKVMLDRHHSDQKKIEDLERQIKNSSQDLEDERQNCSYLKKQVVRVLKKLQKTKDHLTEQSKRKHQDHSTREEAHPPSPAVSSHSSLLDGSFLVCPCCQTEYPASHYRELMNHLEVCLD